MLNCRMLLRLGLLLGILAIMAGGTILADAIPVSADISSKHSNPHRDIDSECPAEISAPVSPPAPNSRWDVEPSIADYLSAGASISATQELFDKWEDFTVNQLPRNSEFGFFNGTIRRVRVLDRRDAQFLVTFDDFFEHEPGADAIILECRDQQVRSAYQLSLEDGWFPGLMMYPRSYVGDRTRRLYPLKVPMRMHISSVQDVTGDGLDDVILAPEIVGANYVLDGIFILSAHNEDYLRNIIRFPWAEASDSPLEFVKGDSPGKDMVFRVGVSGSNGAGVPSPMTETWSFNGEEFTLQKYVRDAPEYQIRALEDGDEYFWQGQYDRAQQLYHRVISDSQLQVWDKPETVITFGYVRLLQLAAKQGQKERLVTLYEQLTARRSADETSGLYVDLGTTFYDAFLKTSSYERACEQTVQYARTHPQTFKTLLFGSENYDYRAVDMCIP